MAKVRGRNQQEGHVAIATLAGLAVMGLAGLAAYKYQMPTIALGGLVAGAAAMGVSLEMMSARA